MKYRELGKSGIQASTVALGAWAIGGAMWGGSEDRESIATIRRALDIGMTLLDTAPFYGLGHSEEVLGKALEGRRSQAVVATKVGLVWDATEGDFHFNDGTRDVYKRLSPESIRRELEDSLRRMRTDYIDLYQTHWQTKTTPVHETMAELMKMKEEGKIRAIGVSNASPAIMDEYLELGRIEANQPRYSLMDRNLEKDILPYCREHDIAVLCYSPLAQGLLTGKITPDRKFPPSDQRVWNPWVRNPEALARLNGMLADVFQPIASGHGITLTQLAIAWVIGQPGVTSALCGARTPAQVDENAAAANVRLTDEELVTMRRAVEGLQPPA